MAVPNPITALASSTYLIFALRADNTLAYADATSVPLAWTALPYGGTGTPDLISAVVFPGPVGQNTLFVHGNDDTLWSWTYETGEWLARVYPP